VKKLFIGLVILGSASVSFADQILKCRNIETSNDIVGELTINLDHSWVRGSANSSVVTGYSKITRVAERAGVDVYKAVSSDNDLTFLIPNSIYGEDFDDIRVTVSLKDMVKGFTLRMKLVCSSRT
jgi:hypothetical protein